MFRKESPDIFDESKKFELFKSDVVKEGKDVTIACSGIMVNEAIIAAQELNKMGIDAEIINVHTIKPIDKDSIIKSVKKTGAIVTAENHNIIGGLRSAICEILMEEYPVPFRSVGIRDVFGQVGKMPYLKEVYNMTYRDIINQVKSLKLN